MLAKTHRLKKKKDISRMFSEGRSFKEGPLLLKTTGGAETDRFGFIVSQKVAKRAVVRNKIKRRLREALKKRMPVVKKGVEGIFIALPGLEKKGFSEIDQAVDSLLKKAKCLKD